MKINSKLKKETVVEHAMRYGIFLKKDSVDMFLSFIEDLARKECKKELGTLKISDILENDNVKIFNILKKYFKFNDNVALEGLKYTEISQEFLLENKGFIQKSCIENNFVEDDINLTPAVMQKILMSFYIHRTLFLDHKRTAILEIIKNESYDTSDNKIKPKLKLYAEFLKLSIEVIRQEYNLFDYIATDFEKLSALKLNKNSATQALLGFEGFFDYLTKEEINAFYENIFDKVDKKVCSKMNFLFFDPKILFNEEVSPF